MWGGFARPKKEALVGVVKFGLLSNQQKFEFHLSCKHKDDKQKATLGPNYDKKDAPLN